MFRDRTDAGHQLALRLLHLRPRAPIILGLPRGGVEVAREVADILHAPIDILLVRKLGAPRQPELALGAIVDSHPPEIVLNPDIIALLRVPGDYLRQVVERETLELERRRAYYRRGRPMATLDGRCAIVVDDGVATGATALAALRGLRQARAARRILAVPVASPDSLNALAGEADEIICLESPGDFTSVGTAYHRFDQLTDAAVLRFLGGAT